MAYPNMIPKDSTNITLRCHRQVQHEYGDFSRKGAETVEIIEINVYLHSRVPMCPNCDAVVIHDVEDDFTHDC